MHNLWFSVPEDIHARMLSKVHAFSAQMTGKLQSSEYYRRKRNATNPLANIRLGKYGEMLALWCLHEYFGFPWVPLDLEVRNGSAKGWVCDLPFHDSDSSLPNAHVKTCDYHTSQYVWEKAKDNYSWTFQYSNPYSMGGRDEIFDRDDDLVVLMYAPEESNRNACLVATSCWRAVKDRLRDPLSLKLVGIKKCLYYKDLLSD